MINRSIFSILICASFVYFSNLAFAEVNPTSTEIPRECKNYSSQLAQKKEKLDKFKQLCTSYQTKVVAAKATVTADENNLTAPNLTKRVLSKLKRTLKSDVKTLAKVTKYATGYCNKVNLYQEDLAKYEAVCKAFADGKPADGTPIGRQIVRSEQCNSNEYKKVCVTLVLDNGICAMEYDQTYYTQAYYNEDYKVFSQPGYQITFPLAGASPQVGLVYKLAAKKVLAATECKTTQ